MFLIRLMLFSLERLSTVSLTISFAMFFCGDMNFFIINVWKNANIFDAIQYTPIPLGNMNANQTDIAGIISIVQPIPGVFATGFVFFCCNCVTIAEINDVTPERIGISQYLLKRI